MSISSDIFNQLEIIRKEAIAAGFAAEQFDSLHKSHLRRVSGLLTGLSKDEREMLAALWSWQEVLKKFFKDVPFPHLALDFGIALNDVQIKGEEVKLLEKRLEKAFAEFQGATEGPEKKEQVSSRSSSSSGDAVNGKLALFGNSEHTQNNNTSENVANPNEPGASKSENNGRFQDNNAEDGVGAITPASDENSTRRKTASEENAELRREIEQLKQEMKELNSARGAQISSKYGNDLSGSPFGAFSSPVPGRLFPRMPDVTTNQILSKIQFGTPGIEASVTTSITERALGKCQCKAVFGGGYLHPEEYECEKCTEKGQSKKRSAELLEGNEESREAKQVKLSE